MEIFGSLLDNSTSVDFGFEHNTDGLGHSSTCWAGVLGFFSTKQPKRNKRLHIKHVAPNLIAVTLVHSPSEYDKMRTPHDARHQRSLGGECSQVAAWILELMEYQTARARVLLRMHSEAVFLDFATVCCTERARRERGACAR